MAEGKDSSDMRTVAELNENYDGGYVQSQKDNASLKAGQTMGALKAQKDKKMINDEGLTDKVIKANEIAPQEQVAILDAKHDTFYGKNAQKAANNVVEELRTASLKSAEMEAKYEASQQKMSEEETANHIAKAKANKLKDVNKKLNKLGMVDDNYNAISGDAMVSGLAKLGAMNYASSKTLTFDGMDINMGIDSSTGDAKIHRANASRDVKGGNSNEFKQLNSEVSGDRKEHNDNVDIENKGQQLNYDPLIDLVGNDTIGEIAKGVLQGAVVLGALDTVTGGKVRDRIASANKKLSDYRHSKKEGHKKGNDGKWYDLKTEKGREEFAKDPKNLENLDDATKEKYYSSSSPTALDGNKNPQSAAPTQSTTNTNTAPNIADDITDSSSKDLNNYNTSESKKAQNYNEKTLNDKKTDLIKKDPDKLARETMFNQAQQKYKSNVDDFRSGKIDQKTFSENNAKLSSFMSKVNSGGDIGMKDLKDVGIKPTQELPMETKMSKNNKPYEVINTSEYGQQLKEVEANKIRVAEENSSKFDANGNPKVEAVDNSPKTTVDTEKVQSPDVYAPKSQVQHPKIENFMIEVKTVTVKRNNIGDFYICISLEIEIQKYNITSSKTVGIDFGLSRLLALSDKKDIESPLFHLKNLSKLKRLNRNLAKKQLVKVHMKIANQRKDYFHKLSNDLANSYDNIFIEDLNMKAMQRV